MEDHSYNKPEDNPNFTANSYVRYRISSTEGVFLCDYLYKLHLNRHISDKLKVIRVLGIPSIDLVLASKPMINYNKNTDHYSFDDTIVIFSGIFEGSEYELSLVKDSEQVLPSNYTIIKYFISIMGTSDQSSRAKELLQYIMEESLKNSIFKNKTLTFNLLGEDFEQHRFLDYFNIAEPSSQTLDGLFIPEIKKEQFERFIYAAKHFNEDQIGLKYLLNGPPGTGKTQLMKAVMRELKNELTIVITQGGSFPVDSIFEFCKLFEPCLLIIDDVDFVIGERDGSLFKHSLGTFLQFLDGFVPNSLFLIASTNDKKLVDEAASRPGRFDVILDIGEINPENYQDLICRETSEPAILQLFNTDVLDELRTKKVTGAFIVSLIKQLTSIKKMKGEISMTDFRLYLDVIYKGFYGNNSESFSSAMGF